MLAQIKDVNAKRAELDRWEQDAKNSTVNDNLQCLNDVSEGLEKAIQEVDTSEPNGAKGRGKMPAVCPELLDSDEEFLEAAVEADSSDVRCPLLHWDFHYTVSQVAFGLTICPNSIDLARFDGLLSISPLTSSSLDA